MSESADGPLTRRDGPGPQWNKNTILRLVRTNGRAQSGPRVSCVSVVFMHTASVRPTRAKFRLRCGWLVEACCGRET